jgi:uncharacterized protein YjiS (DUF1127 family)
MEVAMIDTPTIASDLHQPTRSGAPVGPSEVSRRHCNLSTLGSLIATWRRRIRFRRDLGKMSTVNPHLIDDIGLTRQQAEEEIAKPFWQR